jgi:hypothetical protein
MRKKISSLIKTPTIYDFKQTALELLLTTKKYHPLLKPQQYMILSKQH